MLVVALFIIFEKWKQPKHPLIDEWINKIYTHTVGYYLIMKRNEALIDTSQPEHG